MSVDPTGPDPAQDSRGQPWPQDWWQHGVAGRQALLWRGVDARYLAATLRWVDSPIEQLVLEQLLDASKPPAPRGHAGQHDLLLAPFRYTSPHGSRFRAPGAPGVWYGAEELRTACIEVTYWRWRFLCDSEGLTGRALVTEHTFFQAQVTGACVDLTQVPWRARETDWQQADDYRACQALAIAAQPHQVAWIRYGSVRDPGGHCAAVLQPDALAMPDLPDRQTWVCKVSAQGGWMMREGQVFAWRA